MSYKFDTIVNKQEAEALKDMIFKRAQERAASANQEVQNDVMDMARTSFVSKNNPFSNIVDKEPVVEDKSLDSGADVQEIGFPQKVKSPQVVFQSRMINEQIAGAQITNTMQEARAGLSNKSSFMGALNFLNTQAAVSLIRTRADKFELLA